MTEETIFTTARQKHDPCERSAYLDEVCAGDPAMRQRVEALLKSHEEAAGFLEQPALDYAIEAGTSRPSGETQAEPPVSDQPEISLDFLGPSQKPGSLGRLAHYDVLAEVGQGGMGVVLKAFDEVLQRVVAIKVMAPQLATTASARKRFTREAQAAAAIRDEHVIDIHAVDVANGLPYLVMEYVNGISLQQRLDQSGPLEVTEILRIGMQTAAGLAKAHAQGLIHRDIKPANILLENGVQRVKITDFGLARAVDDASLTQSGVVAGTPQYMAPEQACAEPVDHRADLFSLGSVLYAMCTGHPPFRGSTTMAVLKRVCEDTPRPVRDINPEIPEWLAEIIEKLHAKHPIDRFQSASEVANLLGQHLAHLQRPDSVPAPARIERPGAAVAALKRYGRRWAVAAAMVLLLLGGLGLSEGAGLTRLLPTMIRILTPNGALVVEVEDPGIKVAIEGDGDEIAITGAGPHEIRLRPGSYKWRATRDGVLVNEDWVTVTRGGKPVVRVRAEAAALINGPSLQVPLPARQFGPHGVNVNSVAFLPGGHRFVSAGSDGTLRLWDTNSGSEIRRFIGHTGQVMGVAVSRAGDRILSCSQDKTLRLWEVATGNEIRRFKGHGGWIYGVALSPDGRLALSAGTHWAGRTAQEDSIVFVWEVETGRELRRLRGHTDAILAVGFSPDGRRALSASFDGSVRLWDVDSGRELRTFPHTSRVYAVAFSPDGRQFISACGGNSLKDGAVFDPVNCVIRLWDIDGAREVRQFRGHTAAVRAVAWSPNGRYILSATGGEFFGVSQWQPPSEVGIRLWDAASGRELCRFNTPNSIWSLEFARDGRSFLSGGGNGFIGLWDLPQGLVGHEETGQAQLQPRTTISGGSFSSAAFSRDGRFLALGSHNTVQVWDQTASKQLFILRGHHAWVWTVAFSPDSTTLASACMDNTIKLWDVASGRELATLEGHTAKVWCVAFSPDGKTLASASDDCTIRLWDAATGKQQKVLGTHDGHAYSVLFAPDGKTIISGAFDGDVRVWEVASGKVLAHLDGHTYVVRLAISADGKTLATASHDLTVRLWDLGTRQLRKTLRGHTLPIERAAFSPDGNLLATVSGEWRAPATPGEIKLWDVASGKELLSLHGHRGPVHGVAFAPDGKTLASASADGTAKLWDISDWAPAPPPFVILSRSNQPEKKFASLAEAVAAANDFDTIEVRGNGLFLSSPIFVRRALTIRAGTEPSKAIEGMWQGSLKVAGMELRLATKISRKGDALTGTLDSVDQGSKDIPIEEVTFKGDKLRLNLKGIKAEFEGTMSQDGSEIGGRWKQSGLEFPLTFKRVTQVAELNRPQEPKPPYPYAEEEVAFENKKAGVKLAGTLTRPRSKGPFPAVLLITGSGPQDRDETLFSHKPFKLIADYLTRRGIAVLRVDDRGVGKSTGNHGQATTLDFAEDVEAGVAYLKSRSDINGRQIGLLGHSEGAIIAPMVAARSKDIAFIVMLAGTGVNGEQVLYSQGQAIMKAMGASARDLAWQRSIQEILFQTMKREPDNAVAEKVVREAWAKEMAKLTDEEKKEAERMNASMNAQLKRVLGPWFRFFLTYEPAAALKKVQCPVLALNGEKDLQVDPKQNLPAIAATLKAGGNKDFTTALLPGLNHLFQTCKTGAVTEYGQIEETMAPAALELIATWTVRHTTAVKK